MSQKSILILLLVFFFFGFNLARAEVIINEIMYNPKTSSWVEIYNNTDATINLESYKILDAGANKEGHGITFSSGSNPVPAHTYAILATNSAISKFG